MKAINPPKDCDICDQDLKSGKVYYDAAIPCYPFFGLWGWVCEGCAAQYGIRTGTGLGQEYDSKTNEKVRG